MKETPILFRGDLVRAVLDGRKTMTRRPVKPQPDDFVGGPGVFTIVAGERVPAPQMPYRDPKGKEKYPVVIMCPYGEPGDRLWVRETWASVSSVRFGHAEAHKIVRKADQCTSAMDEDGNIVPVKWKPSIHMPRWASRITLEITNVRVERIRAISLEDVHREGYAMKNLLEPLRDYSPEAQFRDSWNATYPGSWDSNEWVWVIEFKRLFS